VKVSHAAGIQHHVSRSSTRLRIPTRPVVPGQPQRSSRCWRKIRFVGIAIVQVTERCHDELAFTAPRYGTDHISWLPGKTVGAFHQGEIAGLCGTAQGLEMLL
jgi:hypothetical protein